MTMEKEENIEWKIDFIDVDRARIYCDDPEMYSVIRSYLEDYGYWMWRVIEDFEQDLKEDPRLKDTIRIIEKPNGLYTIIKVRK